MVAESQLEMFADEGDAEDVIYIENLTLDADKVLMANVGKFHNVLVIGLDSDGASYYTNLGNVPQWIFWLRRCEEFMMRNCN